MTINELLAEVNVNELKCIHVDTYFENPYQLLNRANANNIELVIEDNRLQAKDKTKTMVFNILIDSISDAAVHQYSNDSFEIRFIIKDTGIVYKVFCER